MAPVRKKRKKNAMHRSAGCRYSVSGWARPARRQSGKYKGADVRSLQRGQKKAPARVGPSGREVENSPSCEVELSFGRAALVGPGSRLRLDGDAKSAAGALPPGRSAASS